MKLTREFNSVFWLLSEKILRLLSTIFVMAFIARNMTVNEFGFYTLILSICSLASVVTVGGSASILISLISQNNGNHDKIITATFLYRALLALFGFLLSVLYFSYSLKEVDIYVIYLSCILVLTYCVLNLAKVAEGIFLVNAKTKYTFISSNGSLLVGIILKIVSAYYGSFELLLTACIFELVVYSITLLFYFKKSNIRLNLDINSFKLILDKSYPLLFTSVVAILYMRLDTIMLKELSSISELSIYSISTRISEAWVFVPAIIVNAFFPKIISTYENKKSSNNLIFSLFWSNVALSLLIILLINLLGETFILLLFTQEYIGAYEVLVINSWVGMFITVGFITEKLMIMHNNQNIWCISQL